MSEKLNLARLKKFGQHFEVSIDPELAQKFRAGELKDVREALHVEQIFVDAHKGLPASSQELLKVFQTTEVDKIAEIIIKQGELQQSAEQRGKERELKWNRLVYLIHRQVVDPNSGLPHPAERIDAALKQAKFHLQEQRGVEEQLGEALSQLKLLLPLKIEQKRLSLHVPARFVGVIRQIIKNNSKILKEEWNSDGSWSVKIEIPAGIQIEFIEKLNSLAHGELNIQNE